MQILSERQHFLIGRTGPVPSVSRGVSPPVRNNAADTPGRIEVIVPVARDDVYVNVHDRLPGGPPAVNTDVVPLRRMRVIERLLDAFDHDGELLQLRLRRFEDIGVVAPPNDERMSVRDGKPVGDRIAEIALQQGVFPPAERTIGAHCVTTADASGSNGFILVESENRYG